MLHPFREFNDNPLSAGFFYASLVECAAVATLFGGYTIFTPLLVAAGFAVATVAVVKYRHGGPT